MYWLWEEPCWNGFKVGKLLRVRPLQNSQRLSFLVPLQAKNQRQVFELGQQRLTRAEYFLCVSCLTIRVNHSLNHLLTTHSIRSDGWRRHHASCVRTEIFHSHQPYSHQNPLMRRNGLMPSTEALVLSRARVRSWFQSRALLFLLWIQTRLSVAVFSLAPVATDEVEIPSLLLISALIFFISSTSFSSLKRACFSCSSYNSNLLM